ncbi:MAG: aminodeoxychorismate/anthranilate synthase component II [Planctomycetaceae bacterium]|nr:aminodeoxychorismate/anthranilate synthase component II [Planctomycetaceae bacterium]
MLLLIDNYDSFVHNLARYVEELGVDTQVVRNDAFTVEQIAERKPQAIILSPGPCTPNEAGVSVDAVRSLGPHIPLLGVCLGHQAIGQALGARIVRAPAPMHGMTSEIHHNGAGLFAACPQPLMATRYHSLIVDEATLPTELQVTARSPEGLIMGLQHRDWPVFGVQFHPESILTQQGHLILANFLRLAGWSLGESFPTGDLPDALPEGEDFFRAPIAPDAHRPL